MNTVDDLNSRFNVTPKDRCIALSSLSFDLSVYDIFGMLGAGAAIVIPAAESVSPPDPGEWLELVEREGITIWNTVPAFVQLLVNFTEHVDRQLPSSLRTIFMSGDWIPLSLPPRIRELTSADGELRVVSMGGATEAAVWSNTFEINAEGTPPAGWSSIPYGVPMRNQTMHVLEDATMQRCEEYRDHVFCQCAEPVASADRQSPFDSSPMLCSCTAHISERVTDHLATLRGKT
jgi:yersiniabactin nonribosomal peptide synthetase